MDLSAVLTTEQLDYLIKKIKTTDHFHPADGELHCYICPSIETIAKSYKALLKELGKSLLPQDLEIAHLGYNCACVKTSREARK